MKRKDCDLCQELNLTIDKLLYRGKDFTIVKNNKNGFRVKNEFYKVKSRITIICSDHVKKPSPYLLTKYRKVFKDFLLRTYSLKFKKDYDFHTTMNVYPNHWHMNACVYPYTLWKIRSKRGSEWIVVEK